jgi:ABC-type molybdenum transport system ATPase subunit/photorepair protein PhrA
MTEQPSPVILTRDLSVGYSGKAIASIPDLDLAGGVVWHVTGPNGSGKTALLKTLAGLLRPISGQVERRCAIGAGGAIYIHSVPYLFAGSVRRNLTLAHPGAGHVQAVADAFGLSTLLGREASTLSHGEQRRLALARAIAGRPRLLLVDEPEGGLDDEAMSAWRACAARAVDAGNPVLVVAAHRPLAFDAVPVKEIRLLEPSAVPRIARELTGTADPDARNAAAPRPPRSSTIGRSGASQRLHDSHGS